MTPAYQNWNPILLRLRDWWMAERSLQDTDWAFYVQRDEDGMVHASPLLSGAVSTWGSALMDDPARWEVR